jgi:nitrate reductase gamma subunit
MFHLGCLLAVFGFISLLVSTDLNSARAVSSLQFTCATFFLAGCVLICATLIIDAIKASNRREENRETHEYEESSDFRIKK